MYPQLNYRFTDRRQTEPADPKRERHTSKIRDEMFRGDELSRQYADIAMLTARDNEEFRHCRIGRVLPRSSAA